MTRKLRIAVSVIFGLLTVALCVLWVRSYWRMDVARYWGDRDKTSFVCGGGKLSYSWLRLPVQQLQFYQSQFYQTQCRGWDVESRPITTPAFVAHFVWRRDRDLTNFRIPFWLPVLVSLAAFGYAADRAGLPLHRLRFSVLTLLIATTLLAVVLGLAVWLAR
jgi:hypothetical protein